MRVCSEVLTESGMGTPVILTENGGVAAGLNVQ